MEIKIRDEQKKEVILQEKNGMYSVYFGEEILLTVGDYEKCYKLCIDRWIERIKKENNYNIIKNMYGNYSPMLDDQELFMLNDTGQFSYEECQDIIRNEIISTRLSMNDFCAPSMILKIQGLNQNINN